MKVKWGFKVYFFFFVNVILVLVMRVCGFYKSWVIIYCSLRMLYGIFLKLVFFNLEKFLFILIFRVYSLILYCVVVFIVWSFWEYMLCYLMDSGIVFLVKVGGCFLNL